MALELPFCLEENDPTSSFHCTTMQNKFHSNEENLDVPFIRIHTSNIFASAGLSKMFYLEEELGKRVFT